MEYNMTTVSSLTDLLNLSRKDYDDTAKAEKSRIAFIDKLIADGFTSANTSPVKKGSNVDPKWRKSLMLICAGTIKIKGKRLSDADLGKFGDDAVSNKVLLAGTAKGNISGETTWKGNATSFLGKVRKDLEARAMAGVAGTPRTPSTDTDIILGYLQKAYTKTFKDAVDLKCDLADLQKELRALGKALGAELKGHTAKK
jgi:hypothetical protein